MAPGYGYWISTTQAVTLAYPVTGITDTLSVTATQTALQRLYSVREAESLAGVQPTYEWVNVLRRAGAARRHARADGDGRAGGGSAGGALRRDRRLAAGAVRSCWPATEMIPPPRPTKALCQAISSGSSSRRMAHSGWRVRWLGRVDSPRRPVGGGGGAAARSRSDHHQRRCCRRLPCRGRPSPTTWPTAMQAKAWPRAWSSARSCRPRSRPQAISTRGATITPTAGFEPFVWQVADLEPGAGGIITVTAILSPALTGPLAITNTALITAPLEAQPGDNVAQAVLHVIEAEEVPPPVVDLAITKEVMPQAALPARRSPTPSATGMRATPWPRVWSSARSCHPRSWP